MSFNDNELETTSLASQIDIEGDRFITQVDLIKPPKFDEYQDECVDEHGGFENLEPDSILEALHGETTSLNEMMNTTPYQDPYLEPLQAVEATQNVDMGNKELSQAIQRNSSSRTFLLLFLFVLTFSILFLDWYS
ncbi:syntaxin-81-like [Telopea speciosissima]|uniref:syntaxin-81-like n=1 Tax=Telopea speciosissima TaxID=54955 RepID=UPI001CC7EB50|nr:syntaxin-81-like [Telopea speciosissima]